MADLLADTLSALPVAQNVGHSSMDWKAVLEMMVQARSQGSEHTHSWLALCLCTICAGIIVGTVENVSTKVEVVVIRHVLLEALGTPCMWRDGEQAAAVLKVVSASLPNMAEKGRCEVSSDQVPPLHNNNTGTAREVAPE